MQDKLNRSIPPAAGAFSNVALPAFRTQVLSNGTPVHLLQFGTVEVAEVQVVFRAGKSYQPKTGLAGFASSNMMEGTASFSSLELARELDRYGAWINRQVGEESLSFTLSTTTKNIESTLPLLKEVVFQPVFPEEEFETLKQRMHQKMQISARKTSYQARRHFANRLYGDHVYGSFFGITELEQVQHADVKGFHADHIKKGNMNLVVVGRFDEGKILELLEARFGRIAREEPLDVSSAARAAVAIPKSGRYHYPQEGMQATLRLGHLGMKRSHPDYYSMLIVNTIFGGYFGSRLMKNIREEKGYTYGIYSGWGGNKHAGSWIIQADVGVEYIEPAITEIKKEINTLISDGVPEDELELVKNFLLGKSISQRETPFQLGDLIRFSVMYDISFEEIDRKFDVIRQIGAGEIRRLAETYFKPDDLVEVVVGGE